MNNLMARLASGKPVLMDGALGTELERRGVPVEGSAWSAVAMIEHGDIVRQVHEDYLSAGAGIHIVNSFALARHVLEPAGLGARFEALNTQSVALFDEAAQSTGIDREGLYVAGSLSTFAANSDRSLLPDKARLLQNYQDQARCLANAGVDLFALEMLFDLDVSKVMLDAVKPYDLPVIIGITCQWDNSSCCRVGTHGGLEVPTIPLDQLLSGLIDHAGDHRCIFSIMHSEIDVTDAALEVLKNYWGGPVAIYPNSGQFRNLRLDFDSICSPAEFSRAAARWIDSGVEIVGGCCGLGPDHIRDVRQLTDQ